MRFIFYFVVFFLDPLINGLRFELKPLRQHNIYDMQKKSITEEKLHVRLICLVISMILFLLIHIRLKCNDRNLQNIHVLNGNKW